MICVYTVTHKVSGKVYVGKTKNASRRWIEHRYEGRATRQRVAAVSPLYAAMKEHGESAFEFSPIEWCESDEDACAAEVYWIEWYGATDPARGYNLSTGGNGSAGHAMPEHQKAAISSALRGKKRAHVVVQKSVYSLTAKRAGVSLEEYMRRHVLGERSCGGRGVRGRHWVAASSVVDGPVCQDCQAVYRAEFAKTMRDKRKALKS